MDNNIYILLTIFIPLFTTVITLVLAQNNRSQRWVGFMGSVLAWGTSLIVLAMVIDSGPQTYRMGGYIPPYGIVMVADMLSALFRNIRKHPALENMRESWSSDLRNP